MSESGSEGAPPQYAETKPCAALRPWVACYWSITGMVTGQRADRVLPDGCADIILDLGLERDPYVAGAMRSALVISLTGRLDMFGVRFQPGGALPFLDTPLHELTDRLVPLDALWGRLAETLFDTLASAAIAERVPLVERVLLEQLRTTRADAVLAVRAASLFQRARGGVGVREVAASLGVGERRLERVFDRCVGLTPKALARVARFTQAVRRIEHGEDGVGVGVGVGSGVGWTEVAFGAGYADQAHFIREFRSLAGVTPTAFVRERRGVGFVQYPGEGGDIS